MMPLVQNVDLPVRPHDSGTCFGRVPGGIELRRKTRGGFGSAGSSGGVLLFWLAGWSITCALLVLLVRNEPRPLHFLVALPFWAFWFYVLYLVLDLAFGQERLLLTRDCLLHERSALVPLRRRRIPIWKIGAIKTYSRVVDRESGRTECGICIEAPGRPIRFAVGAPEDERRWLMQVIRAQFGLIDTEDPDARAIEFPTGTRGVSKCDRSPDVSPSGPIDARTFESPSEEPEEITSAAKGPLRRPPGSPWASRRSPAGIRFVWHGRWPRRTIAALVLLIILAAAAVALARTAFHHNPTGFSATLYALAQLTLVALSLATAAALSLRFCRREWLLGHAEIITRLSLFGFCFANWHPVNRIARVVVRRENRLAFHPDRDLRSTILSRLLGKDTSLVLLDEADRPVTKLRALAPEEARWIGSELRRAYAGKMDAPFTSPRRIP